MNTILKYETSELIPLLIQYKKELGHLFPIEKLKHLSNLENMIFQLYNNEIDEVIESKKRLMWMYPNFTILTMMALIFALAIFMLFDTLKGVSVV